MAGLFDVFARHRCINCFPGARIYLGDGVVRKYENLQYIQEKRLKQRAYYIPEGEQAKIDLNGMWNFRFYSRDYDEQPTKSGMIDVPSC